MDEVRKLPPKPPKILLYLLRIIYYCYSSTLRFRFFGQPMKKKIILASYHRYLFFFPKLACQKELSDHTFSGMVSNHTHGEFAADLLEAHNIFVVRGDSLHEGFSAIRSALKAVRDGYNLLLTVDGPVGPRYGVKPGIMALAKQTKKPIQLLFTFPKNSYIIRKSWDHFVVPYPFSLVYTYLGDCFIYDDKRSREENLEAFRLYMRSEHDRFLQSLPKDVEDKLKSS